MRWLAPFVVVVLGAVGGAGNLSAAPVIVMNPQDLTLYRGERAVFTIVAEGTQPLSYQWRKDTTNVPGATASNLVIHLVRSTDYGVYDVMITDSTGESVFSANAVLTVIDPTVPTSLPLPPVMDTSIFSSGINPQGITSILAGTRSNGILDRGLLCFDLEPIPANAVIYSARLRLTLTKMPRTPANSDFSLHRMLRSWDTEASWNFASENSTWASPGAASGSDYAAAKSATQFVAGGGFYEFGPTPQMMADIRAWTNSPGSNHGWLLKTDSESVFGTARHFGSSESAQPPRLVIEYSVPPTRPHLVNPQSQGGVFRFQFMGAPGWIYRVESRGALEGAWTTVTNAPAGSATMPIVITTSNTPLRQFFRVVAE